MITAFQFHDFDNWPATKLSENTVASSLEPPSLPLCFASLRLETNNKKTEMHKLSFTRRHIKSDWLLSYGCGVGGGGGGITNISE